MGRGWCSRLGGSCSAEERDGVSCAQVGPPAKQHAPTRREAPAAQQQPPHQNPRKGEGAKMLQPETRSHVTGGPGAEPTSQCVHTRQNVSGWRPPAPRWLWFGAAVSPMFMQSSLRTSQGEPQTPHTAKPHVAGEKKPSPCAHHSRTPFQGHLHRHFSITQHPHR